MTAFKLAGKQKNITLTQAEGRLPISFYTEQVSRGLFEFTVCSYDANLEERHEYVTTIDVRHAEIIRHQMQRILNYMNQSKDKDLA